MLNDFVKKMRNKKCSFHKGIYFYYGNLILALLILYFSASYFIVQIYSIGFRAESVDIPIFYKYLYAFIFIQLLVIVIIWKKCIRFAC